MSWARTSAVMAMVLMVTACTMIPHYERPQTSVAQAWPGAADAFENASDLPASAIGWRDFYVDPQLQKLIGEAFQNSPDARLAALQVAKVRAQYQLQRSAIFPHIDASGSYTKQHSPGSVRGPVGGGGGGTYHYYQVGVGLTAYELDLFGRIRSLNKEALQQYFASQAGFRSARISLVAAVSNAYLQLLANHELLALAKKTRAAQSDALDLIQRRFDAGIASQLDVYQAATGLDTARADVARFSRQLAQSRNALVALVGVPVSRTLYEGESLQSPIISKLPRVGLPSQLLLRRPDVLAAEHELKAANARIGAARAAFFPRITLTGSYGTVSTDLSGLFEPGSGIWSFIPKISIPIFAGGRNQANLDVAQVSKKIEVAQYRKTIRNAFREVADALAAHATLQQGIEARRDKVKAASGSYSLARKRYLKGIDSYLAVLDSLRTKYQSRQELISAELLGQQNRVELYKVLGGGWRAQTSTADDRQATPVAASSVHAGG